MRKQTNTVKEALEPERSGGGKASLQTYNSEVPEIPKKRRFSQETKLRILKEIEACKIPGGRGLIIRREGLFSSQISQWKKVMGTSKKKSQSNSPKNELARLKRENVRLKARLKQKDILLEAQKKMAELMESIEKSDEKHLE